ncbi:hypothetical protein [Parvicella tangerina]|uniref:Uncharacterized protein n=1 Tax=Parvicella tangerina TaxID=2829795 RepID=A0A916JJG1_9FLAO|nr:hypothetical protein [Parvicella tangerina]CAG5077300.1 hypothetical protein CRYO30217_00343 [Parvicella tangerina]
MKKQITYFATVLFLAQGFTSCSTDESQEASEDQTTGETTGSSSEGTNGVESQLKNEITALKYMGSEQSFDQEYVYANYSKTYNSYRVIYLNYDRSKDSDFGGRTGDETRIIIFLHNPEGGEFKPGKYTPNGNENGMNKGFAQVENAEGTMSINTAVEDPGQIEITAVNDTHIAGKYHLRGKLLSDGSEFEISGSFNTQHEPVN